MSKAWNVSWKPYVSGASERGEWLSQRPDFYWLRGTGLPIERQTESFPKSQGSCLRLGLDIVSQLARTRKFLLPVTETLSSDSFPYLKP